MMHSINVAEYLLDGKSENMVALRLPEADYSYGDLGAGAREFAAHMTNAGCTKGDRILLLGVNSFHWAAAYLGILQAEMVCVPLPGNLHAEELEYYVETTRPRAAYVDAQLLARYRSVLAVEGVTVCCEAPTCTNGWFQFAHLPAVQPSSAPLEEPAPIGLAALMFTSGSTGQPRGVMVSHRNIVANTNSIVDSLQLSERERMMAVLPFYYCFGASVLHTYLKVGAMLVIDNRFAYPEVVLERMDKTQCTSFAGVPSHYQILLRNSSLARKRLPHLRTLLQAGGHLASSFVQQLQQILPRTRIFIMYGQTEATARLACLPPEMLAAKPESIGKAIPGVRLRIVNESGEEAARGKIGEIVADGENVTLGYWRAPGETALVFRNGSLHTGDLATMDEDGFLYVIDRAKEFVKCGGTRISCRQIEDKLLECEELLEAAVIAVRDDLLGEAVRAFVVPRQGANHAVAERVRAFCKSNLSRIMIPRDIVVLDSLPKSSHGKVQRMKLRTLVADAPGDMCIEMAAADS